MFAVILLDSQVALGTALALNADNWSKILTHMYDVPRFPLAGLKCDRQGSGQGRHTARKGRQVDTPDCTQETVKVSRNHARQNTRTRLGSCSLHHRREGMRTSFARCLFKKAGITVVMRAGSRSKLTAVQREADIAEMALAARAASAGTNVVT